MKKYNKSRRSLSSGVTDYSFIFLKKLFSLNAYFNVLVDRKTSFYYFVDNRVFISLISIPFGNGNFRGPVVTVTSSSGSTFIQANITSSLVLRFLSGHSVAIVISHFVLPQ